MHSYVFPGDIDEAIMRIGADPFIYMRTDYFSNINLESERLLLDLIHCKNGRTIIYTGSGTGAMAAVVENYVTTRQKAIVIDGGSFGHRWYQMCQYYDVPAIDYQVPFGKDIDYDEFEKTIRSAHPDVLLCQHHETSSGQLFNLIKLSEICHKHSVSMVVDVISSFLAEPLDMDALGLDICITSTQKGLNIPPGLSIIFLAKNVCSESFSHRGYYWDFEHNLQNLSRGQTPFSPATILYLQLNLRLRQLANQGGADQNIHLIHARSQYFKELCRSYGWPILAETPSSAITGFQTRDTVERFIFKSLIKEFDTYIMPGSIPGFYRVSHMGRQTDLELKELASRIFTFERQLCEK